MDDRNQRAGSPSLRNAAADWFVRRQRGLTPREAQAFDAWLKASENHREALRDIELNWEASQQLANTSIGKARRLRRAPFLMRRSTHVGALGVAVACVVGIVSLGLVERIGPYRVASSAEAAYYSTRTGEIRTFKLTDGTRLTLDSASSVRIEIDAEHRLAVLRAGRARVAAGKDSRPFMAVVDRETVQAREATFDISAMPNLPLVAVLKGSVAFRSARSGRTIALKSGEQTRPDGQVSKASRSQEQWVRGIIGLDNTALSDAVALINRYNAVQVRLRNPDIGQLRITGGFRASDPDTFVKAISVLFHLRVSRPDRLTIVLER